MAIYTQNQLDRLSDKVHAGGTLTTDEALNLIQDCAKLRVDLIDARESVLELETKLADGVCPLCAVVPTVTSRGDAVN